MSSKAAKKEDKTVLTEILGLKNGESEDKTLSGDPQNKKVQEKFDAALSDAFNSSLDDLDFLELGSDDQTPDVNLSESASTDNQIGINLDMDDDSAIDLKIGEVTSPNVNLTDSNTSSNVALEANTGLDLDFGNDGLDLSDINQSDFDEATKKTQIANLKDLDFLKKEKTKAEEVRAPLQELTDEGFNLDFSTTDELIGSEDSKSTIEKTIQDIVTPKDATGEFSLDDLTNDATSDMTAPANTHPATELDLNFGAEESEPTREFEYKANNAESSIIEQEVSFNDDALINQAVNTEYEEKTQPAKDIASLIEDDFMAESINVDEAPATLTAQAKIVESTEVRINKAVATPAEDQYIRREVDDDEYIRLQATIRQLREEREDLVSNIKDLKIELKEYETDNLTMKAALDETKIEVAIMRKRHATESEDLKYRLTMAEEKRSFSEEKMRNLEKIKEKLEQKARIDISQVRQREKELESKLELMAMDVDSQVHSRDQKILELRRKIDALEFNMENASIREQKSNDDKRKLEDKLNKIMKTLRNSIKNLEDDIEESAAEILRSDKEK